MNPRISQEDLAKRTARRTGLTQDKAREAVQTVLDLIGEALAGRTEVTLGNFGTFLTGDRPYASGVLADGKPHRGVTRTVRFRATGRLKEAVRTGEIPVTLRRSPKS